MDFWMLRMQTGYRLSNPKRRKAAKIHAFGRVRITPVTIAKKINDRVSAVNLLHYYSLSTGL